MNPSKFGKKHVIAAAALLLGLVAMVRAPRGARIGRLAWSLNALTPRTSRSVRSPSSTRSIRAGTRRADATSIASSRRMPSAFCKSTRGKYARSTHPRW